MTVQFEPLTRCPGKHPDTFEPCQSLIDTHKFDLCSTCRYGKHPSSNPPRRRYRPERESPVRNALPPTNGLDVDQRSGVITSTKKQRTTNDR